MDRFSYLTKRKRIPRQHTDHTDGLYAFDFSSYKLETPTPTSHALSPDIFGPSLQKNLQSPTFISDAIDLSYFPQDDAYPATVALDIAGTTGDLMPTQHTTTLILAKHALSPYLSQLVVHQSYGDIDEYETLLSDREQFGIPLSSTTTPQTIAYDPYVFIRYSQDTVYTSKELMTYRHHKLLATALGALASSPHALQ